MDWEDHKEVLIMFCKTFLPIVAFGVLYGAGLDYLPDSWRVVVMSVVAFIAAVGLPLCMYISRKERDAEAAEKEEKRRKLIEQYNEEMRRAEVK